MQLASRITKKKQIEQGRVKNIFLNICEIFRITLY